MCELELPEIEVLSRFDLENFQTLLLPVNENKPLDGQALRKIKMTLFESGPRILANHLTRIDLDVIFSSQECNDPIVNKLTSGMVLCALPHGHHYRMDLIER